MEPVGRFQDEASTVRVGSTGMAKVPEPAAEPGPETGVAPADLVRTAAQFWQKLAVSEFSVRQVGQRVAIVALFRQLRFEPLLLVSPV